MTRLETAGRSPVLTQAAWLMFDRSARLIIAFAVSILVARELDPSVFGTLSYANATVSTLSFVATLGLEAIVVRMLAQEPEAHGEIVASAIFVRALGGAALIGIAAAAAKVLQPEQPVLTLITALIAAASLFQSAEVVEYWLRQKGVVQGAVIGRQLVLVGGAAGRVAALAADNPLIVLAAIPLAEAAAAAIVLLALYARSDPAAPVARPRMQRVKAMLAQCVPLLIAAVAVSIYVRIGVLILGAVSGNAEVGIYTVATLVSEASHAVPFALMAAYAPSLLQRSGSDFDRRWERALRLIVLLGLGLSAAICALALWLMPLVFGAAYATAGSVLTIHIWSAPFVFMSIASEAWFLKYDRLAYYPAKTALGAASSVALNLALVPYFGAHGAAMATVVSYSVSAYWANALFAATRPLFWRQSAALVPWPRYSAAR